jgi:DNA-binding beta-propeller fold protein YncE
MRRTRWQGTVAGAAFLVLACSAGFVGFVAAAPQGSGYHLLKKITLGGEGNWDELSVDPDTHRVFISRGTHTMVVDADGKQLADIPKTEGVHGIAFAPKFKRGFITNGRANTVTMFDLSTLQTISEIKVTGETPDGILYDPATKRVFALNHKTGNSTAIDAKTGEVAGTIQIGGPVEAAQGDGAGHIYVTVEDKESHIVEFDSKALKVLNTWPTAPCEGASGLAFDVAHNRLFAGCTNQMMAMVDSTNGKVVATIPIGKNLDAAAFDPATGLVFASCGEGTMTVAHEDSPDKYTVLENVVTQNGARTMALDPKTHKVYLITADFAPAAAATPENPRPRPTPVPNTFTLLIFGR